MGNGARERQAFVAFGEVLQSLAGKEPGIGQGGQGSRLVKCDKGEWGEQIVGEGVKLINVLALSEDTFQNMETRMTGGD